MNNAKKKLLYSGASDPKALSEQHVLAFNPDAGEMRQKGFNMDHDIEGELEAQAWFRKVGLM